MKEQYTYKFTDKGLEEYVKSIREAAVLAEREACAKVCEEYDAGDDYGCGYMRTASMDCAAAIRARGEK